MNDENQRLNDQVRLLERKNQ